MNSTHKKVRQLHTSQSYRVSEEHRIAETFKKEINQVFEAIDFSTQKLREYYAQQCSEFQQLETKVAELDSQISDLENARKKNPATAKWLDAAIQEIKKQRDAITAKPRENFQKFLEALTNVAQGLPQPQEMDNMIKVGVKK